MKFITNTMDIYFIFIQSDEVCSYTYFVEQQFGKNTQQNFSLSATVEITCHSGN